MDSRHQPILAIQRLNHDFGQGQLKKRVLHNLNLDIQAGEIVIMTGPSGSGKTTVLTLVGGLRSAQSGSLQVLGQELVGATAAQLVQSRRHNGYIFQAHNLHHSLTALQNVAMGLEVHGQFSHRQRNDRAMSLLTQVGLADKVHDYPDNLSAGQKQRIAIARALVSHPKLVLADEPTASLDSKSGRDVVNLMQTLTKEQGCTILLVTHDNRILDIADRLVHMEDGRLKNNTLSTMEEANY